MRGVVVRPALAFSFSVVAVKSGHERFMAQTMVVADVWNTRSARRRGNLIAGDPGPWGGRNELRPYEAGCGQRDGGIPVTSLAVEIEGEEEGAPTVAPPARDLLAFCSFAFAARFAAQHELSLAALRLKEHHKIDLRPFTTYVDGAVHEDADTDDLERAWQDASRVAESAAKAVEAIRADEKLTAWLAEWPAVPDRLIELEARARWAADRGRRVRLTFLLD